jgi:hypothetical protein
MSSFNKGNVIQNMFKKKEKNELKKKRHSSMIIDHPDIESTNVEKLQSIDDYETRHNYGKSHLCGVYTESVASEDNTNRIVVKNVAKFSNQTQPRQAYSSKKQIGHVCEMCNNRNGSESDSFIILSCNHVYHIKCLADEHHYEAKKCHVLDEDYFDRRKCNAHGCQTTIETSEILFIHNKFYKGTKDLLNAHDEQIKKLDQQMNRIKDELKVSMEYKQKLEYEREKSKQIIAMLNTML